MSRIIDISGTVQTVVGRRRGFWGRDGYADISVSGKSFRTEFQESDQDIYSSVSYGLVQTRNALAYTASFSPDPPSWSQKHIGPGMSCVISALSSSRHEEQVLNCFRSGTESLEVTSVPASGTLYYDKASRFRTVIYKLTSSHPQGLVNDSSEREVPLEIGTGTLVSATASHEDPKKFFFSVNETGRLQNIRVWVETVNGSGSGYGPPLSCLAIALRSPSVRWGASHPIRNDPSVRLGPLFDSVTPQTYPLDSRNEFYHDTFILWEGWRAFTTGSASSDSAKSWPSWDNDCDMRTVFDDGSPYPNPRHIPSVGSSPGANVLGSPNASGSNVGNAFGANVPWTTDVNAGKFGNSNNRAPGSPPPGWLSSVNAPNEWPTTGSNIGAPTLRPLYPLLDDIVVYKTDRLTDSSTDANFPNWDRWRGFRPGLRGSEISGTWEVMFTNGGGDWATGLGNPTFARPLYVRQVRLEITYSTRQHPSKDHFFPPSNPISPGEKSRTYFSGSDFYASLAPDHGLNEMRVVVGFANSWGRTFGLSTSTASFRLGDTALFWRLSGALSDLVGENPSWIVGFNGMPMIPASSSSLVPASSQVSSSDSGGNPLTALNPRLRLGAERLSATSGRILPRLTIEELARQFSSGSG